MATNLKWVPKEGVTGVVEGFVGDATNKAFTITTSGANSILESHVTGAEAQGGTFASEALAKGHADLVLESNNIPQYGTQIPPVVVPPEMEETPGGEEEEEG